MTSMNELEAKKKELQLKRDIARMELEQSSVTAGKGFLRWMLAVGIPAGLALAGAAHLYDATRFSYQRGEFASIGVAFLVAAWFVRKWAKR